MKDRWQRPQILALDALDAGLGDCQFGGTPSDFACVSGKRTSELGTPHRCANGGLASTSYGGCDLGSEAGNWCLTGGDGGSYG